MNKIEQVREALEAAKHAMTNQRYLLPRLGTEDAHAKVTSALAILKDMDGQEPVAWMYKGGDSRYPAYLTLEKDIAEEDADDPSSIIPLYAHPSPSAPVELSEEDIERMVTEAVPGFAIGFAKELVSHITKHYTLHPKP